MHKTIRRFGMEGEAKDDADFARLRVQFESYVVREMRETGYVPILGMGPFWSTYYEEEADKYHFILSVHGVHVGRRLACQLEGISVDGKQVKRSTAQPKSKPSSEKSE